MINTCLKKIYDEKEKLTNAESKNKRDTNTHNRNKRKLEHVSQKSKK